MKSEIRKIVYVSLGALTIISILALVLAKNIQKRNDLGPVINQQNNMEEVEKKQKEMMAEEREGNSETTNSYDSSDLGNSEVDQAIKEMDDLINSTSSSSDYDESNLSDDAILE